MNMLISTRLTTSVCHRFILQQLHSHILGSFSRSSSSQVSEPRPLMYPPPLMLADVSLTSKHRVSLALVFPPLDADCNRQSFGNSSVTNQ